MFAPARVAKTILEQSVSKSNAIKVRSVSIAEARANLSKIARRAHDKGEYFFVFSRKAEIFCSQKQ